MNILITSIVDLSKTSHNRLHQFIRHLSRNHRITVLSINDWWKNSQTDVRQYLLGVEDILRGVDIRYFTARKIRPYLQEVFSIITVNSTLKEIDYTSFDVHLNYNTLISGYYVARRLRTAGIDTVYDIADDLPAMVRTSPQIAAVLRPLGGFVADIMIKRNIKIAQKVTFITRPLSDSYHIPSDKAEYIPNGADIELFKSYPSAQLRKELGLNQVFVLGYVGVLREWIDFEPIFAAVAALATKCPDMSLLIVGEEGGLEKVKNLAAKYGIADKIVFTGTIPYTQVPRYISCMDACLTARKVDPVAEKMLPLKLLEYMACEKPVISTRLAGIQEAVQDKVLYATSKTEYQEQIARLYNDKELGRKMGQQGREFVQRNFSWASAAARLEGVLEEAAEIR